MCRQVERKRRALAGRTCGRSGSLQATLWSHLEARGNGTARGAAAVHDDIVGVVAHLGVGGGLQRGRGRGISEGCTLTWWSAEP